MNDSFAYHNNQGVSSPSHPEELARLLVYENATFLGDNSLTKPQVSIGRSRFADVILDNSAVADIHALIHFHQGQVFLTNNYPKDGLRLNGGNVKTAELRSRDIIQVGPFALHLIMPADESVRINALETAAEPSPAQNETPLFLEENDEIVLNADYTVRYDLILVNRYANEDSRRNAAKRLAKLFQIDQQKTLAILKKENYVLKTDLSPGDADKWQSVLKNAGVLCLLQKQSVREQNRENLRIAKAANVKPNIKPEIKPEIKIDKAKDNVKPSRERDEERASDRWPAPSYEEEDQDEDEWAAPFALSDFLNHKAKGAQTAGTTTRRLMVVKHVDDVVTDIRFLEPRQKYIDLTRSGRFRFAEFTSRNKAFVYFSGDCYGFLESSGEKISDLDKFKSNSHLHNRRKDIYRMSMPETGALTVAIDNARYSICLKREMISPDVKVPLEKDPFSWRHWAVSAGTHLMVLLCFLVYGYLQALAPKTLSPQFVKIDPALMEQLNPKKPVKEEPKKAPPPPKPEPQKVAPAKTAVKKTPPKRKPAVANAKKRTTRKNVAARSSKHPKAGGGYGKGNITNRNINQAGLLSVLGSSKVSGSKDVIASVTNLDAVEVPGATEKNFTVGGLKGSLGNGKISLASGAVVQTKGSKQVLRSAGARGKGEVAALERGNTGKKQVKAMVSATMSRTVKIEGGMSREMVKRVIDQHLEDITYCYETALINNPSIMGRIVFEWKILMSGRVGEIRIVASSVNSHEIHECIRSAIKSWQFPKPVGAEVVVSYPFIFDLVAF